ncbi:MAG: flotillin-like protein FloA [Desulfobacteraceae bacterium]|nr:flotillin-like protein FloA [Desulfobacteraceae bacterium]MBC2757771.1 flotillin-like protein FloA [Desulfobacteraceae bacterium]MBC2763869.1 flotillin-like protein FloA [ANME-2 cluster archaeon]
MGIQQIFVILLFIALIILIYFIGSAISLWVQALVSGARVGLFNIVFMRFRKVPPKLVVTTKIMAVKAGLSDITTDDLESHFLAGGEVMRVVQALIAADKANIELKFNRAAAIDLAGRNVLEAVQMSVNPKVIETPIVAAMAKDGIQLKALSRVTVRANLDRLVGGAGEETILARVGEGIVTTIGSSDSHKKVLENPDSISKRVLEKGLDAGTAYEILSIDIADVDVGKNIGAELETDRAEADKKIAQAKAEERRAMAIAAEQEMMARVQEMRAKVVEAEAQVPLAMADAFRQGNLGVMDYLKIRNIQADTQMRDAIGGPKDSKGAPTPDQEG